MKAFVTGAAGFVGSNLVDALLLRGDTVVGYDNFSTGFQEFLAGAMRSSKFELLRGDLLDTSRLTSAVNGCDIVFHLAANADVRFGTDHPMLDLEQNTTGTFRILEAMRATGVRRIVFSSTGSVYGETTVIPTPENAPFPVQTSLYGASKVACEGLISAYSEGFGFQGLVFRFVSILGPRYTHGHIVDFYRQLRSDPLHLLILGDGRQKKSYLHISDCIAAILTAVEKSQVKYDVFNLGTDEYCEVNDLVGWIASELQLDPIRKYTGGQRGWIGDNTFILLDCRRMRALGWRPHHTIENSVRETTRWIRSNDWILERRP